MGQIVQKRSQQVAVCTSQGQWMGNTRDARCVGSCCGCNSQLDDMGLGTLSTGTSAWMAARSCLGKSCEGARTGGSHRRLDAPHLERRLKIAAACGTGFMQSLRQGNINKAWAYTVTPAICTTKPTALQKASCMPASWLPGTSDGLPLSKGSMSGFPSPNAADCAAGELAQSPPGEGGGGGGGLGG